MPTKRIKIHASSNSGSIVDKVGKYLKNNIDGAYKIKFSPMECEVTMRMYYQVPGEPDTTDEMQFLLNITSYQNKVRVNITEDTAMEKTIGQVILTPEELNNLTLAKRKILSKVTRFIEKEYSEYDFIY